MSRFLIMSKSFLHIIIVASIGMLSCKKSEVKFNDSADSDVFFEVSRSLSTKNSETTEQNQSTTFYTDPSDEIWVNKTITELKKLNEKDKYVTKVKQKVGLPIWNRSLVFVGGDSTKTVITPIYDTAKKIVKGAIFSFHGSQFNCRVVPRSIVNSFRDTARSVNSVSKESIKAIFSYFDTQKANYVYNDLISGVNKIKVSEDNVITTGEIQYIYCYYILVSSYNSGGVFQRQCVAQTYWGSYQDWDYYYSDYDNQEGYYDSFSEEEIQKAEENWWEKDAIDTIGLNECLRKIIGKLMLNNTNDIGKVVNRFTFEPHKYKMQLFDELDLNFKVVPNIDSAAAITTQYGTGYRQYIEINQSIFDKCTDLYAAHTIMHEILHAYMNTMIIRARSPFSNPPQWTDISLQSYPDAFRTFVDYVTNGITSPRQIAEEYQHDYMANHLITVIADALAEYDGYKLDYEYYWCLAWGGLDGSDTWKKYMQTPELTEHNPNDNIPKPFKYALTRERLEKIKKINFAEQEGLPEAKGVKHDINNNCY